MNLEEFAKNFGPSVDEALMKFLDSMDKLGIGDFFRRIFEAIGSIFNSLGINLV